MPRLSLDQLTVIDVAPLELVAIAAETGCELISLFVNSPAPELLPAFNPADERVMKNAMAAAGVSLGTLECFDLSSEVSIDSFRPALELGARLGGIMATAINYRDPDLVRVSERFAKFSALCAEYGVRANLEPIAPGRTRTVGEAQQIIESGGAINAGIVIDALHLFRSGGTVADLAKLPKRYICYAQLCDAPASVGERGLEWEAACMRLDPGDGALPLTDFVRTLPAEIVFGVEVPNAERRERGETARERAIKAVTATRSLLERAGR